MSVPQLRRALFALAVTLGACAPAFKPNSFPSNDALFQASVQQFERERWDNAVAGFERLTLELPARDPLLPRAYWYLSRSYAGRGDHLLAGQTFVRLTESFPDDSLADDALLEAGRQYGELWRRPVLDPQYGNLALSTFRSLVALYPDSPLADEANQEIDRLTRWLAEKDFRTGMFYMRRKAYDPAIIYFRDVVERYPETPQARQAQLKLVEAFQAIRYREDAAEVCTALRSSYPDDREVREACGEAAGTAVAAPTP